MIITTWRERIFALYSTTTARYVHHTSSFLCRTFQFCFSIWL